MNDTTTHPTRNNDQNPIPDTAQQPRTTDRPSVAVAKARPATPQHAPNANRTDDTNEQPASTRHSVFVSPRVLDENAFADFSARLRELIAETDDRANAAAAAAHDLASTEAKLSKLATRQRRHLELASRVLKAIDERAKAAQLGQPLDDPAELHTTEHLEQRIEHAVNKHLDERINHRIEQVAASIRESVERTLTLRIDSLEYLLEQQRTHDTPSHATTQASDETNDRLDALEAMVADRIEARLDAIQSELSERSESLRAELHSKIDRLGTTTEPQLEREKAALKSLVTNAATARDGLVSAIASADTDQLAALVTQATDLLRTDGNEPSLAAVTARAEAAAQALAQHNDTAAATQTALAELGPAIEAATTARDELNKFVPATNEAVAKLPGQTAAAAAAADRASHQGDHLADLLTAAECVLERLEPWRPLLTGDDPALGEPDAIPAGLARILHGVERRVADLAEQLGGAMRDAIAPAVQHGASSRGGASVDSPSRDASRALPGGPSADDGVRFRQVTDG